MALQNHPNLYTGGSAVFDSSPTVNTYRQIEAERRAKDEALDKYVRELNMKITPTGMRRQEDEVFRDKYAQWMNLGKDRQKLNNPQYRMEFEMRGQELRNLIERSKAEEEAKKPLVPLLLDPKKRQELRPEVIGEIDLHDQPLFIKSETGEWIENPNRKRIDISSNLFKSPEFDLPGFRKKVVGEHKPGEIVELDKPFTDKQTGLVYYPAKEKFSKDQIAKMGKDAERFVSESEDNKAYYATRLATIGLKEYQELDNVYNKYFGGRIGKDENAPAKLAAAEAAAEAEQFVGKETMKSKQDWEARQQAQINKIYIQDALIRGRQQGGGQADGNAFDDLPDADYKNFYVKDGVFYNKDGTPKSGGVFLTGATIPGSVKSALKAGGLDPDDLNKGVDAVLSNGKIQVISNKKIGTITRQSMQGVYQRKMDTERKGESLEFDKPTPNTTPGSRLPKDIKQTRMNWDKYRVKQ